MTDFEDRIRKSLRPAASMPVPVAPLDPDDLAARAGRRPHRVFPARVWLAAAAAVAVVAGVGGVATIWPGRGQGVPAAPIAPTHSAITPSAVSPTPSVTASTPAVAGSATVQVLMFSGRRDPVATLPADVADELYAMLADQEAAGLLKPSDAPPADNLGFRGFLVTPKDRSQPALQILPTAVYLQRAGDLRLDDPNQNFYNRVYDAIAPQLDPDVRAALPSGKPAIPTVGVSVPPQVGATATWTLTRPESIDAHTVTFEVFATRLECASGKTGKLLAPVIAVGDKEVVIRIDAKPRHSTGDTCPSNNPVRVRITLPEPLGHRSLVDAACLVGEAVSTTACANGAARSKP
ncbi:hypothetical protein ATK74_0789 [Propionicimonas paludicola]|uniref:Uncharacterized protein n=1 Tax=Propionicimonas paludicola TaxID=185243 RepID=A0A2A9CQ94_9ACTN|nr:hypothetical protein [Propionicimonas paludicola]PFG16255.1 hypothetical protein ATK74_0789 [Propionicimonas paludicola]